MEIATAPPESSRADESLAARLAGVRSRIGAAARRSGRRAEEIVLVAVTKFATIDQIRELLHLGQVDLGENRVQVLLQHAAQVEEFLGRNQDLPGAARGPVPSMVRWHLIGSLQRNKVRKLIDQVRLIHTVDSLKLAEELQAAASGRPVESPLEVLVQVNVSGERQKAGVAPAAARHLVEQIDSMLNLRVRGLMCMAPLARTDAELESIVRPVFRRASELFEDIRARAPGEGRFNLLSMGMSGDFDIAIECGANVVRVGSAIFGTGDGVEGTGAATGQ
ncbi:MAG: YggS family pyridoxal phosphate-dependent enzyme [Phycisphaeraceae bacterium]|nr:YggS family pyridoxal phosphate-dependent enzyme [Phycisphaeraceae bacterium]